MWGADTLSGRAVEIAADLVVLATPMAPGQRRSQLGQRCTSAPTRTASSTRPILKLRPVETLTAGIFLAGAGQGPKDIPETVAQASGGSCQGAAALLACRDDPVADGRDGDRRTVRGLRGVRRAPAPTAPAPSIPCGHRHRQRGPVPELRRVCGRLPEQGLLACATGSRRRCWRCWTK